jgi:hypothetical protein
MTPTESLEMEYHEETGMNPYANEMCDTYTTQFVHWLESRVSKQEKTLKMLYAHIAELEKE